MSQTCSQGTVMEVTKRSENEVGSTPAGYWFKIPSAASVFIALSSCRVELHVQLCVYTLTLGSRPVWPQSSTLGKHSLRINKSLKKSRPWTWEETDMLSPPEKKTDRIRARWWSHQKGQTWLLKFINEYFEFWVYLVCAKKQRSLNTVVLKS